jgi:hypothetical protein
VIYITKINFNIFNLGVDMKQKNHLINVYFLFINFYHLKKSKELEAWGKSFFSFVYISNNLKKEKQC